MSRAFRALQLRWTTLVALAAAAAMVLSAVSIVPALGAPPHQECKSDSWNGEYWKQQFDDKQQPTGLPETSTNVENDAILIQTPVEGMTVNWTNNPESSVFAVFRTYEKNGKASDDQTDLDPPVMPGEGGTIEIAQSLSHITFCFTSQPEIQITKLTNGEDPTATDPNFIPVGDTVTWSYDVGNTGTVGLRSVSVTDDQLGQITNLVSGDTDGDSVLDPGETWRYEAAGTSTAGAYDSNLSQPFVGYENTGTVTADSVLDGTTVTASDDSGYYGSNPSIDLDVTRDPSGVLQEGESFTWTFTVTNDGNVPLNDIEVQELLDGQFFLIEGCNGSTDLLPGEFFQCMAEETATIGQESSTFRAEGTFLDGTTQTVIDETVEGVTLDINRSPTAVDDSYTIDERDQSGPLTLVVPVPGVLDNDSDPDGDSLSATNPTTPTNGGSVTLNADGSFSYTPSDTYTWGETESSRVDTFSYTADDGRGGSDDALVSITVNRKLCEGDTVVGSDGDVTGSITLVESTGCKDWVPVIADEDAKPADGDEVNDPTILFQPDTDNTSGVYLGVLERDNVLVEDGTLPNVTLEWDPTPDNTEDGGLEPMPACELNADEEIVLPDGATTGWCFYDVELDLVGDQLWDVTWLVKGWDDPSMRF